MNAYEQGRMKDFLRLFRPFTPTTTAKVLGEVIGDVHWEGCSKSHMAEDYAYGRYGLGERGLDDLKVVVMAYITAHVAIVHESSTL